MSEKRENPGYPEGEAGKKMLDRMNRSHAPLRDWGLPHFAYVGHMHILDVGCGGGATIHDLLDYAKDSIVEGIDYAEESVKQTTAFNKDEIGSRVFVQKADVAQLPFDDNSFDLITAVETVYFWPDIKAAFSEIRRVLKPGGSFMILCEGSDPDTIDWPQMDTPIVIYRPEELVTLLSQSDFTSGSYDKGPGQYICVIGKK